MSIFSNINLEGVCVWQDEKLGTQCISSNAYICAVRYGKYKSVFYTGITCGQIQSDVGSCCLYDPQLKIVLPCQEITFNQCNSLATQFGYRSSWYKIPCRDTLCSLRTEQKGACCDGNGLCKETTKLECEILKRYYQGDGIVCSAGICSGGTGACCDGISCENGITGTYCIENKNIYFGKSKSCSDFLCDNASLDCFNSVYQERLKPGDSYGGGIVVGVYNPGKSSCLGHPYFSPKTDLSLLSQNEMDSFQYTTRADGNGYGFNSENVCDFNDSYLMIISNSDLTTSNDDTSFVWSRGGKDWGPLYNEIGNVVENNASELINYNEGYIKNSSLTDSQNSEIISNNHNLFCQKREDGDNPFSRVIKKASQGLNGRWSSDWGIYNTVRLVNAYLFNKYGISVNVLSTQLYSSSSQWNSTMTTAVDGIIQFNVLFKLMEDLFNKPDLFSGSLLSELLAKGITRVSNKVNASPWFIPSHNEMAYLMNQVHTYGLNNILNSANSVALNETYWTSTGAFDYPTEGVWSGSTISGGSMAWVGNFSSKKFKRISRLQSAKLRPIRMIRCDGKTLLKTKYSSLWEIKGE